MTECQEALLGRQIIFGIITLLATRIRAAPGCHCYLAVAIPILSFFIVITRTGVFMGTKHSKDKAKRNKWFGAKTTDHTSNNSLRGLSAVVKPITAKIPVPTGEHWFCSMPKTFLSKISTDFPVISIGDRYDSFDIKAAGFTNSLPLVLDVSHLHEKYNPAKITVEKVRDIIRFICSNNDKPILVHCTEGVSRSPAVVDGIAACFRARINFDFEGISERRYGDAGITRDFIRVFKEVSIEPEMSELIAGYKD